MTALSWALIVASGVYARLRGLPLWMAAAGVLFGALQDSPALVAAGLMVAWGFGWYSQSVRQTASRDGDAQAALLFLVRLRQLLSVTGTLSGALQEMGYRLSAVGGDASEQVLQNVANRLEVDVLSFVSRVAGLVRRHGGALGVVVEWAVQRLERQQALRFARRLEEAAQRTTIVVLALAPWGVLVLFRFVVASFYRSLLSTPLGHTVLLSIAGLTATVLAILASHIRGEARVR